MCKENKYYILYLCLFNLRQLVHLLLGLGLRLLLEPLGLLLQDLLRDALGVVLGRYQQIPQLLLLKGHTSMVEGRRKGSKEG
jgi:hypothetical protein